MKRSEKEAARIVAEDAALALLNASKEMSRVASNIAYGTEHNKTVTLAALDNVNNFMHTVTAQIENTIGPAANADLSQE